MIRSGSSPASEPAPPQVAEPGDGATPDGGRTTGRRVRLVVVGADETVEQVLARHPGAIPSFNRTLRVALAMRGGVSLAVWIGGTVAELDLLRRIRLHDLDGETLALVPETARTPLTEPVRIRLQAYAEMLDAAGYDRVEFDLLAGASAGGLNAVMYSVAQRAGTGLDGLLTTWGRVGGFWGLLYPPRSRRILALMQGEAYFRHHVFDALQAIYDTQDRHVDLASEYAGVDLSATVIDASDEFEEDANEGRGHFRFIGTESYELGNRVPARHREREPFDPTADVDEDPCPPGARAALERARAERDAAANATDDASRTRWETWSRRYDDLVNLSRLALAARSTSSLPGGFEPALVHSVDGGLDDHEDAVATGPGMRFAFAAHREAEEEPYRIVDGAVFDNVPIERALRAARSRVSIRRADRAMMFLDPEPDPPLGGGTWDPNASTFFNAVKAMYDRQLRRESVAREVAELERFNGDRQVAAARFESAAPLVASALRDPGSDASRRNAYVRALGVDLADHLAETISAPSLWQLHSSLESRRRYRPIPLVRLTGLADAAADRVAALSASRREAFATSALAVEDAANCILGWARALEALPEVPGGRQGFAFGAVRTAAYDALTSAIAARDRATAVVLGESDRCARDDCRPDAAELGRWVDLWLADSRGSHDARIWENLNHSVARLRIASERVEAEIRAGTREATPEWARSPFRPLASAGLLAAADLPPLFHAGGIPPALSSVRYWSIGVDEAPAEPGQYRTLVHDKWFATLSRTLRRPGLDADAAADAIRAGSGAVVLDRGSKLAGYGLGNFLGFLARDWRVNDWWWGRLDGTAGIARFLASFAPTGAADDVDATVRRLQDAVLAESDAPALAAQHLSPLEPETAPTLPHDAASDRESDAGAPTDAGAARRARMRAGTDTIFNLDPRYRFAIASRTVRLVDRVVVQPVRRLDRALAGAVFALLRPLLVPLPTLFDPPRLALVAGFAAAVAWLLTWDDLALASLAWIAIAGISGLVAIAVIVGKVEARLRHWADVATALTGTDRDDARAARARALPSARFMELVAVCSVFPFMIAIIGSNFLLIVLCFGVTVALAWIAVRMATSASRAPIPRRLGRTLGMISVFAVFGGILPIVQGVSEWATGAAPEVPNAWNAPVLAIGAAAVTVALTIDWLRIRYVPPASDCRARIPWYARLNVVNWVSVTLVSVAAGWAGFALVDLVTGRIAPLLADTLAATAFIVAWANVVWWMPEWLRRLPAMPDRVIRAPRD